MSASARKEYRRRVMARWLDSLNGTWRQKAACDPHTGAAPSPAAIPARFNAPDGEDMPLHEQRDAALFCNTACAVQAECLKYAIDLGEEHGVWGGTTEAERRPLLRKERKRRRASA